MQHVSQKTAFLDHVTFCSHAPQGYMLPTSGSGSTWALTPGPGFTCTSPEADISRLNMYARHELFLRMSKDLFL
ncbi:MAG: hypothetical protein N0C90_18130, partial [Candidatus Thiodiazotropha endolucinida]|nr:hypothetical protein [Candidatus Thiodiazotropha taylori]MCW4263274.1 hypothetical protein [Candidatus Thiodiazotropha endolucinida]